MGSKFTRTRIVRPGALSAAVVVSALAVALVAGTLMTSFADESPLQVGSDVIAEYDRATLAAIAESSDISVEEAARRLDAQDAVQRLTEELRRDRPNAFGYIDLVHEPSFHVRVGIVGGDDQVAVAAESALAGVDFPVEIVDAPTPGAVIDSANEALLEAIERREVFVDPNSTGWYTGVNDERGVIELNYDGEVNHSALDQIEADFGVPVEVNEPEMTFEAA